MISQEYKDSILRTERKMEEVVSIMLAIIVVLNMCSIIERTTETNLARARSLKA